MSRRETPSAGAPTLELWPDELDAELPFEEFEKLSPADVVDKLADEATALRRALVDALTYLEAGKAAPGARVRSWRVLAGTSYVDNLTPTERRDDGIARAGAKWTDEEVAHIDKAIRTVAGTARRIAEAHRVRLGASGRATNALGMFPEELTTADVWQELGPDFPVTKGMAGRMLAAKGAGLIENTGRTIIAPRDATGPNHGQRLTVWRAL